MRKPKVHNPKHEHNSLIDYLIQTGIQPGSFAYFLTEFSKKSTETEGEISRLLSADLKAQAELIAYYLKEVTPSPPPAPLLV